MNSVSVFLNTALESSGNLAWIGDKGLAPFRYLFNGKTIRVQPSDSNQEIKINHVASFRKLSYNFPGSKNLQSSPTSMIKATLSVVFLLPGLILGAAFKGMAHLFSDVREKNLLAKEYLTPVDIHIGSEAKPIRTTDQLEEALKAEFHSKTKKPFTNAVIIHGDGSLEISQSLYLLKFNPMKLVLEGAKITHQTYSAVFGRLDDKMSSSNKWETKAILESTDISRVIVHSVKSIDEALQTTAPRRSGNSGKRYHMTFSVPKPQAV